MKINTGLYPSQRMQKLSVLRLTFGLIKKGSGARVSRLRSIA